MSIPITITLNSIVGTPGPFSLYSCTGVTCSGTPFETEVSLASLQGGYGTSLVPNGTTIVKIKSTGESCPYEITKSIVGLPTNTPTPTSTPTGTLTPTPTPLPGCSSIVTGEYTGSSLYNYDDRQLNFAGVANGSTISFTCTANNRPNNISIRTASTVLESTGWFGSTEGYNSGDYWYPTAGTGPITLTITYDNTLTYYIDTLTAPATLVPPNDESDYWEVTISCAGVVTPTVTPQPTPFETTFSGFVSLVNGPTACAGGEYSNVNITVVGTSLCNLTKVKGLSSTMYGNVYGDMTNNTTFWVSDGTDEREFKRDGSAETGTAQTACTLCSGAPPTSTPLPPTPTPQTYDVYERCDLTAIYYVEYSAGNLSFVTINSECCSRIDTNVDDAYIIANYSPSPTFFSSFTNVTCPCD